MPRPADIPDWMYPGTAVVDRQGGRWLIESIQFREQEGLHAFMKPLGRGIAGWFPVPFVAHRYHPSEVSRYPTISAIRLRDYAYRGLISVTRSNDPRTPDLVEVRAEPERDVTLDGIEIRENDIVLLRCPDWEGMFMQIEGEQTMMVSFDGHRAMPYIVREVIIDEGARFVLEQVDLFDDMAEPELDEAPVVPSPPPVRTETPAIEEPVRRISVWDRLAEMKRGPNAGQGGKPNAPDPQPTTTPQPESEVYSKAP